MISVTERIMRRIADPVGLIVVFAVYGDAVYAHGNTVGAFYTGAFILNARS